MRMAPNDRLAAVDLGVRRDALQKRASLHFSILLPAILRLRCAASTAFMRILRARRASIGRSSWPRGIACARGGRMRRTSGFRTTRAWTGHRRLSIIDLSRPGAADAAGERVIIFNGEIYNYRELRARLEQPAAVHVAFDTEVLLALYDEKGGGCCPNCGHVLHRFMGRREAAHAAGARSVRHQAALTTTPMTGRPSAVRRR